MIDLKVNIGDKVRHKVSPRIKGEVISIHIYQTRTDATIMMNGFTYTYDIDNLEKVD